MKTHTYKTYFIPGTITLKSKHLLENLSTYDMKIFKKGSVALPKPYTITKTGFYKQKL